jgi:uncharacterized Tic20 family protein
MNDFGGRSYPFQGEVTDDARTWAILAHVSILLLGPIGPLIVYLIKKDESEFLRKHSAEALSFSVVNFIIAFLIIAVGTPLICLGIGIFIYFLTIPQIIAVWVYAIVAAIRASERKVFEYPFTSSFVDKYLGPGPGAGAGPSNTPPPTA